jgi:CO/xanthine dehydrogenase Mo-binding subunit
MMEATSVTRRQFLATIGKGSLVVGFSFASLGAATLPKDAHAAAPEPDLAVDSWIVLDNHGMVTIFSGKVELGTGVQTALMQIVAEELFIDLDSIEFIQGDTSLTPGDKGFTAGSKTIQNEGPPLRRAAATAVQALLDLAAGTLGVSASELFARDGEIGVGPQLARAIRYEKLIKNEDIRLVSSDNVPLKNPADYEIVGQSAPRVELEDKLTAEFTYLQDLTVKGMLHGRIVRPDGRNASFGSFDAASLALVQAVPGFVQVVQLGNFVGVVATDEWAAIQASRTLKVNWNAGAALPQQSSLPTTLTDPANIYQTSTEDVAGDVDAALAGAARRLSASYFTPYQMHGAMGPSCAVADVRNSPDRDGIQVQVWSGTQGPFPLQDALAALLQLPISAVRVTYVELAGCYGHNGADDAAADAALLSRAVREPVRVQWMRQEEHGWEPLGPAMVHKLNGGLDASGNVIGWEHIVYTSTHNTRPGGAGSLLAGQAQGILPEELPNAPRNAGTRNGPVTYVFANKRLVGNHVRIFQTAPGSRSPSSPLVNTLLRSTALRSLGGFSNSFANESFIDELAAATGSDPVQTRRKYLSDPRALAVVDAMAQQANWGQPPAAPPAGWQAGRGVAFQRYETVETYVATCVDVQVEMATGRIVVPRVVVAHDCGLIINPDGLRNQIEGNVIQGISRTLIEEVMFDSKGVTSLTWQTAGANIGYPVAHFVDVPRSIEIVLLDHPNEVAWGAGEPTIGTLPGAIANALFNATGVRLRTVPFTPARVKAALG